MRGEDPGLYRIPGDCWPRQVKPHPKRGWDVDPGRMKEGMAVLSLRVLEMERARARQIPSLGNPTHHRCKAHHSSAVQKQKVKPDPAMPGSPSWDSTLAAIHLMQHRDTWLAHISAYLENEVLSDSFVLGYLFKMVKIVIVLEKTLESRLDCKEIKSVKPKGNQP